MRQAVCDNENTWNQMQYERENESKLDVSDTEEEDFGGFSTQEEDEDEHE